MRRFLLVSVVVLFVLPACKTQPPEPKLEWSPGEGRAMAGDTLEVRATQPLGQQKEKFDFEWTLSGACAGKLANATDWKATYTVPEDCPGGTLTFSLKSTTRHGATVHNVSFRLQPLPKKEQMGLLPARVDPMPATWDALDDFERLFPEEESLRRNNKDAFLGTWSYRNGKCELTTAQDGSSRVLNVAYRLPHGGPSVHSACGYFEYIQGKPGEAQKADLSGFDRFGFIARTTDGGPAKLRIELVEFDEHANYNQGMVGESAPILIDGEWRRHELPLKKLAVAWDLASVKSIGFRIDARDGNHGEGAVLLDNLVFIRAEP